jgi:hypothetical protein
MQTKWVLFSLDEPPYSPDNHNEKYSTENPRFIDDSLLNMVLFARKTSQGLVKCFEIGETYQRYRISSK